MSAPSRSLRRSDAGQMMPVATILVVFLVIGFWALVSAGQAWTARREAYAVAAVAASAGAQGSLGQLRAGTGAELDPAVATRRALAVLAESGYVGSVHVDGQRVTVTITATVRYVLPSPGMPAIVTGAATARAQRGVTGDEGG
jgi:hypothetical protein